MFLWVFESNNNSVCLQWNRLFSQPPHPICKAVQCSAIAIFSQFSSFKNNSIHLKTIQQISKGSFLNKALVYFHVSQYKTVDITNIERISCTCTDTNQWFKTTLVCNFVLASTSTFRSGEAKATGFIRKYPGGSSSVKNL